MDPWPLPPGAKEVLQALRPVLTRVERGLSREQATRILQSDGFDAEAIPYYLELLLNRGHLYEVDSYLFLTDP